MSKFNPRSLTLIVTLLAGMAGPALATTSVFDFEKDTTADYSHLGGKNATGSSLEISQAKPHDGKQSLRLDYQTAGGYIEFTPLAPQKRDFSGDTLYLSLWVYGAGHRDFASAALRVLDNQNEAFQFSVPGLAEAMGGEGWREVRATVDLTKTGAHWGDKSDGILDRPFAWFGFAASTTGAAPAAGTFYIDGVHVSDRPLTAAQEATPVQPTAGAPARTVTPDAGAVTLTVVPQMPDGAGTKSLPESSAASPLAPWLLPPGAPALFQARLALRTPAQGLFLTWSARDAFDTVLGEGRLNLDGVVRDRTMDFQVTHPPRGVLYVRTALLNEREEVLAEANTRVAVFTPHTAPVPRSNFLWGVGAHLSRNGGTEAANQAAVARMAGFNACRTDLTWSHVQPSAGVWDWSTYDRVFGVLEKEGIQPAALVAFSTPWATTGDAGSADWHQWNNAPPQIPPYTTFAAECVKRYGRTTRYWEIWNEPDISFWLGTAEQFSALMDAAIPAIKAAQPEAMVLNGGFSETRRRPDFIPTYLATTRVHPDIIAVHSHGAFENLLREEAVAKGDLGHAGWAGPKQPLLWLNEAGFSNCQGASEREQAIQLVKKMAYTPAAGFGAYFWYDLRDDGTNDSDPEANFGLVKQNYAPKASLVAAATLLDALGGRRFEKRLPLVDGGYALLYRGGGQTVLALWQQAATRSGSIVPIALRVRPAAGSRLTLERKDIFGNSTPVVTNKGVFALGLSDVPQYVVAQGEDVQMELAGTDGRLLKLPTSLIAVSGQPVPWPVELRNPFDMPLSGRLTAPGVTPVTLTVPANAAKTVNLSVMPPGAPGSRATQTLTFTSDQLPKALVGTTEFQSAYNVPSAPASLDLPLTKRGLVSLFVATPMDQLHFHGDADLSATAQLQGTDLGTNVVVKVTDQTHFAVAAPGNWWMGDSLQWALALPDGQMWQWTAALLPDGAQMVLDLAPDGKIGTSYPVTIRREGSQTIYSWYLPKNLPNGQARPARFNFSFLINDNDGDGRKGWLEWTPGIGMEKNPSLFSPLLTAGP